MTTSRSLHRRSPERRLAALEGLFASDVVSSSDGGGGVRAALNPIIGRERVAKLIAGFAAHFWIGVTLTWIQTNGQPSVLMSRDGAVVTAATIDASAQDIEQIPWMIRPSKLTAISKPEQNNGRLSAMSVQR
jgi:RNA polymerase sigma-70 factor (ECF subfamily)